MPRTKKQPEDTSPEATSGTSAKPVGAGMASSPAKVTGGTDEEEIASITRLSPLRPK